MHVLITLALILGLLITTVRGPSNVERELRRLLPRATIAETNISRSDARFSALKLNGFHQTEEEIENAKA